VVALLGSVLSAVAASVAMQGKLNMVHIQNATLAGGVAIGAAADLQVAPGGEACMLMFPVAALRLQLQIAGWTFCVLAAGMCASVLHGAVILAIFLPPPLYCSHAFCTLVWCTGALAVGLIAGALSTAGYQYLGPALESKIGLRDTCGVHNLHGLPGILGGLAATVATVVTASKSGHVMHHGSWWVCGGWEAGCCGL
jgi:ammonia channel protein AmtB